MLGYRQTVRVGVVTEDQREQALELTRRVNVVYLRRRARQCVAGGHAAVADQLFYMADELERVESVEVYELGESIDALALTIE